MFPGEFAEPLGPGCRGLAVRVVADGTVRMRYSPPNCVPITDPTPWAVSSIPGTKLWAMVVVKVTTPFVRTAPPGDAATATFVGIPKRKRLSPSVRERLKFCEP